MRSPHAGSPRASLLARHVGAPVVGLALLAAGMVAAMGTTPAAGGTSADGLVAEKPTASSGGPVSGTLYEPDLAAHPEATAGYPRAAVLRHSNRGRGTTLATFAERGSEDRGTMPVYASTDGGRSWTRRSVIRSTIPGWTIEAPALFEVPRSSKGLRKGDLLAAGTAWKPGDYTQQSVQVFVSRDQGHSWNYLSSCTSTKNEPNTWGHGIWEPFFVMGPDGTLGCFISDERPSKSPTNAQAIVHYTSKDGGKTWSSQKTFDVAFPNDPLRRPGMQEIVELPNKTYVLSYELCRDATHPDQACEVYVKHSLNPFDWSPADDKGERVLTADQRSLLHTPSIAWFEQGGPLGTLAVTGQRVVSGPDGSKGVLPESGRVMLTNTRGGHGPWTEVTTPVVVSPTGGYSGPDEQSCAGYSTPVVPTGPGSYLYLAANWLGKGNQCKVQFGLWSLPTTAGSLYGPGAESRCVDVATNASENGRAISLWDCGVAEGQRFKLMRNGQLEALGRCVSPVGGALVEGTPLELRDCDSTTRQSWTMSGGTLRNTASGLCLTSPDGRNGTPLQLAACRGTELQTWRVGEPN